MGYNQCVDEAPVGWLVDAIGQVIRLHIRGVDEHKSLAERFRCTDAAEAGFAEAIDAMPCGRRKAGRVANMDEGIDTIPASSSTDAVNDVVATACWTASLRAGFSSSFAQDPWAASLGGAEGAMLIDRFKSLGGHNVMSRTFYIRTMYFDMVIDDFVSAGGKQILSIAAGLDTRQLRLPCLCDNPSATVYEVDFARALDLKRARLKADGRPLPTGGAKTVDVPADVSVEGWEKELLSRGFDVGAKTLVLAEGITMYLDGASNARLFATLAKLVPAGSVVTGDFIHQWVIDDPYEPIKSALEVFRSLDAPWLWGPSSPAELRRMLERAGGDGPSDAGFHQREILIAMAATKVVNRRLAKRGLPPLASPPLPELQLGKIVRNIIRNKWAKRYAGFPGPGVFCFVKSSGTSDKAK